MKLTANSLCPCGSTKKYKKCCKLFHDNINNPLNALELMKSRFSAYAFKNSEYIIKTTAKENPDYSENRLNWKKDIEIFSSITTFRNLEIIEFIDADIESFVTFKATLFQNNQDVSFIEKSRFKKENNEWFYVDGKFIDN